MYSTLHLPIVFSSSYILQLSPFKELVKLNYLKSIIHHLDLNFISNLCLTHCTFKSIPYHLRYTIKIKLARPN